MFSELAKSLVGSYVRATLQAVAGVMIGYGLVKPEDSNTLIAGGMILFAALWSFVAHYRHKKGD